MKHYFQPETNVLQVSNSAVLCASGEPVTTQGGFSIKSTANQSIAIAFTAQ